MSPERPHNQITALAETNFRGQRRRFGIKRADCRAHMYIIGKTGTGKSTLIANLARQDALHGEGFALLDPHGDLVEQVLKLVPEEWQRDLIYSTCLTRLIRLPSIRLKLRNRAASVSFRKGQDGWRGVGSRRGLANGDLILRCRRV